MSSGIAECPLLNKICTDSKLLSKTVSFETSTMHLYMKLYTYAEIHRDLFVYFLNMNGVVYAHFPTSWFF